VHTFDDESSSFLFGYRSFSVGTMQWKVEIWCVCVCVGGGLGVCVWELLLLNKAMNSCSGWWIQAKVVCAAARGVYATALRSVPRVN
jgi:hypothetical protein